MASDGSEKADKDGAEKKERKSGMGSTAKMAATAVVTATVLSPQVRSVLRAGAVRGLAGVLVLGDAVASFARGVGRGIQDTGAAPADPSLSASADVASAAVAAAEEAARAAQEAARAAQAAAQAAQEASSAVRKRPGKPRPPAAEGGEGSNG